MANAAALRLFPNVAADAAEDSFIALAVETDISERALQWLIGHNLKKVSDLAMCSPSEELLWTKVHLFWKERYIYIYICLGIYIYICFLFCCFVLVFIYIFPLYRPPFSFGFS